MPKLVSFILTNRLSFLSSKTFIFYYFFVQIVDLRGRLILAKEISVRVEWEVRWVPQSDLAFR